LRRYRVGKVNVLWQSCFCFSFLLWRAIFLMQTYREVEPTSVSNFAENLFSLLATRRAESQLE
jgi:hypothetical protein